MWSNVQLLYVSGKTCQCSRGLFTPIAGPESFSPFTQIQIGFDCCDAQLASEMGHSLQIVARRKSLHVCNAPKADAGESFGACHRVSVVIALPPQPVAQRPHRIGPD